MDALGELIGAAQRGNLHAFGSIVQRFQASAVATAYGVLGDVHLAEDAAQEAFLEAFRSLDQLREPAAFAAWFRRIVVTRADRVRRSRRLDMLPLEQVGAGASASDPLAAAETRELQRSVHAAVDSLADADRLPVQLYYFAGLSHHEIAARLGLQPNAVKQRLWQARQRLRQQLTTLAPTDSGFAREIQFLLAVRIGDAAAVRGFLVGEPLLAQARERWDDRTARRLGLPSAGSWTALHRAAFDGRGDVLAALLAYDVDIDARTRDGQTALHLAVQGDHVPLVELLLEHGADPDARSGTRMSPLHYAAIRGRPQSARLLLAHGARIDGRDRGGRTAHDWASLAHNRELVRLLSAPAPLPTEATMERTQAITTGDTWLGRLLDAQGRPIDGGPPLNSPMPNAASDPPARAAWQAGGMLETGIKAIDFYAPLPRGGVTLLEAGPGTGLIVVTSELAHNLHARHGGQTVLAVRDAAGRPARELVAWLRSAGVGDTSVVVAVGEVDPAAQRQAFDTAQAIAARLAAGGNDCLLVVDEELLEDVTVAQLHSVTGITTLVWRLLLDETLPPPRITDPDAVIVLRPALARRTIYPAVDPLVSRSRLLDDAPDEQHWRTVERVRILLEQIDIDDAAAPAVTGAAERARRALAFQTQPFFVAELYTARPGIYVDTAATVAGFAAIAEGAYDDRAEAELSYIGAAPPPNV